MKSYTYSQARQNLAHLLDLAKTEDVEIRRRDGSVFILRARQQSDRSPLDVPAVDADIDMDDILDAVRESRER
ncbi:prevent-host-death protein [Wenzhouxiangella sp. XN79A]|uniref:type II toxin-antitoxin system Phd/YefM family antitoxin n=1 Tax=Wenzhouxiangella sp. XN79A TaxID=2724193 RepID=UPI00144AABDF|nr:type II toxin-antitoxin system Phd/YefM family antitoxin [Wenzhouxiangella sp. XN79A]NKI33897.1 prevent-host-death protein [Wenzhouxiangella sp. XN79A]